MKKKILFLINNLSGGGAEKVLIHLINFMPRDKYEPILVLVDEEEEYLESIAKDIRIIYLRKKNRADIFKVLFNLIKTLYNEKPDVCISFLIYSNLLLMFARFVCFFKTKIILTEHTLLKEHLMSEPNFSSIKAFLCKLLFPFANCIVAVSESAKNNLIQNFNIKEDYIKIIYNPCDLNEIDLLKNNEEDFILPFQNTPYLISIGRLVEKKNFDLLIKAFSMLCNQIDENLVILGQGHQYESLIKLCKDLNLEKRVFFIGFKKNPYVYLKKSTAFIFTAEQESFGMVIVEAMASGTPVLASNGAAGPREIVQDRVNGLLIDCSNIHEIANAIKNIVTSKSLREELIYAGFTRAKDFSHEKIFQKYAELF